MSMWDELRAQLDAAGDDTMARWRVVLVMMWQAEQSGGHVGLHAETLMEWMGERTYMALTPDQRERLFVPPMTARRKWKSSRMRDYDHFYTADNWWAALAAYGAEPVVWQRCWFVYTGAYRVAARGDIEHSEHGARHRIPRDEQERWLFHPNPDALLDESDYGVCMPMHALENLKLAGAIMDARRVRAQLDASTLWKHDEWPQTYPQMRLMNWASCEPLLCSACGASADALPLPRVYPPLSTKWATPTQHALWNGQTLSTTDLYTLFGSVALRDETERASRTAARRRR